MLGEFEEIFGQELEIRVALDFLKHVGVVLGWDGSVILHVATNYPRIGKHVHDWRSLNGAVASGKEGMKMVKFVEKQNRSGKEMYKLTLELKEFLQDQVPGVEGHRLGITPEF